GGLWLGAVTVAVKITPPISCSGSIVSWIIFDSRGSGGQVLDKSGRPDPYRIIDLAGLVREFDLLRRRAARGTRKVTVGLDDLARRVDIPRSTVDTYVTGKALAPADVLDELVIVLGASDTEQREWAEAWFRVSASLA